MSLLSHYCGCRVALFNLLNETFKAVPLTDELKAQLRKADVYQNLVKNFDALDKKVRHQIERNYIHVEFLLQKKMEPKSRTALSSSLQADDVLKEGWLVSPKKRKERHTESSVRLDESVLADWQVPSLIILKSFWYHCENILESFLNHFHMCVQVDPKDKKYIEKYRKSLTRELRTKKYKELKEVLFAGPFSKYDVLGLISHFFLSDVIVYRIALYWQEYYGEDDTSLIINPIIAAQCISSMDMSINKHNIEQYKQKLEEDPDRRSWSQVLDGAPLC